MLCHYYDYFFVATCGRYFKPYHVRFYIFIWLKSSATSCHSCDYEERRITEC
nr:MAG TPA: hypothetical protein [Caudoviricetes sp.]